MASIRQTVPSYSAGMSEQPDHLKFPGQLTDIVNAIPDVTRGLYKRPGSARVGTTPLASVQSGGSWFHYFRDETEGAYIGQVATNGTVKVWKCSNGSLIGTNYGAADFDSNVTYDVNDKVMYSGKIYAAFTTINSGGSAPTHSSGTVNNWVFIENESVAQTRITNYLQTNTPENLQFLTINDTTFVNNRDATNANTKVGSTGTTAARPEPHFAFVDLLRTENGRQYGINIYNSNTTTALSRATKIEILTSTYDETDGTGHCPGIGTGVFSITAASSYTGTTTNYVHDANGHAPQVHTFAPSAVDASNEHITINNHGLTTGEEVVYSSSGSVIQNLPAGTYYVVKISDDIISLAVSFNDAQNDIVKNLQDQGTGTHTLDCKGVGLITSGRDNLIFRFSALGQQGVSPNYSAASEGPGGQNYRAAYSLESTLLHGGEGWQVGDIVNVSPTFAAEAANVQSNTGSQATVTIKVLEIETTNVKATVNSAADGLIRPAPTPFDADTAITADTILGGLTTGLPSGITAKVIGTGIYYSSNNPFNVEVVEEDLMRVMQSSVNDVSRLPNQCRNGYIVKVANARLAEEDDYYLKFDGQNGRDGAGSWNECPKPGIDKSLTNMPLIIQRTSLTKFTIKEHTYQDRLVGDDVTNPLPSFHGNRINKVLFFRNRLAFLSGENVILSRPGTFGVPDFFIESALTVGPADPIDISASSTFPSEIFDGIEINSGLIVFSSNQQFLLSTDSEILNPETAKLRSIATFNYNITIPPISLGTTIAYLDSSGKFSRFNEIANVAREGEPNVVEQSKVVPTLIPKEVDLLTNSRDNSMVLIGKTDTDTVYGFRYFNVGDKREQQAWFKWKFNRPLIYHFVVNDEYFFLDSDNFLQKVNLVQDDDINIDHENVNYVLHLDNYTSVSGGVYNPTTNLTTFTNQSDWIDQISNYNGTLVVIDDNSGATRVGRYSECTVINNDDFTLPGDWENATLKIGYLYEYRAEFPRIYPTKIEGERSFADINSSVVVHRIKVHFGKVGLYETTLTRKGKPTYSEVYESSLLDQYDVSDAPYLSEYIKTVPVYERNTNVGITLKSSHPSPATLRGLSWEGDYTPRFYRRV